MTTLEGNVFISDELLVAQDNVKSIGKTIESLVIESNQAALEEYLSGSESPKAA